MTIRNVRRRAGAALVAVCWCGLVPALPADEAERGSQRAPFDWNAQRTSVADLVIGRTLEFRHGTVDLSPEEQDAYVDLLRTIREREFAASAGEFAGGAPGGVDPPRDVWETAFYRFEFARRQAFHNGVVRLESDSGSARQYSLLQDMMQHPVEFVGRPVVLYGVFDPSGTVEITTPTRFDWEPESRTFQRGVLRSFSGGRPLAIVDATGFYNENNQTEPRPFLSAEYTVAVPVQVKGWFVKLWGQRPLICSQGIRLLEPEPYAELIREYAVSRQPMTDDERWLFYETLTHVQLAKAELQERAATALREQRVKTLRDEVLARQTLQRAEIAADRKRGAIDESEAGQRRRRLERQVAARLSRYERFQSDPSSFPMFVDLFQNPDVWQGKLVTLSGHVRHAVRYDGDEVLFGGRPLHELWLFTDDSQHNPAVVITPELPEGFPLRSAVIDRVSVTGCFFKMYVYRGQEHHRLAPLILCGQVRWEPTDDQILALADAGTLPADDPRVRQVRNQASDSSNDAAILLAGFAALVVMMTIWGRVQRERRERRRLLDMVEQPPSLTGDNVRL